MTLPSLETFAKGTFATAATLFTIGAGLLYYGQNYLIYPSAFPPGSRTEVALPSSFGLSFEDLELTTPDGVTLRCFLMLQSRGLGEKHAAGQPVEGEVEMSEDEFISSRPTVVMFHGNAGNIGHRIPLARVFVLRMRCNVLMVSYRGYGLSEGSPSEKGLRSDSQTVLDYLLSDPCLSKTPIVLYGQSIGGAVSIDLASRNPDKIGVLILENTFTSLPNLVPQVLPLLGPLTILCHQKWESIDKLSRIPVTTPVLMLSGLADELIPKEHMRALWERLSSRGESNAKRDGPERTKYVEFEKGMHNDTCVQPGYWTAVADFIAALGDQPEVEAKL